MNKHAEHLGFIILTIMVLLTCNVFAQLSKTHYIPPLTNAQFGNANPNDQYIYLSTPATANVQYTIIPVGQPSTNYITGTVTNTNPVVIPIGNGYGQLFIPSTQTSTIVNNRGYIIEAQVPVYVSVRVNAGDGSQAGALVSKGLSALGNTFRVGAFTNENPQDNYLNFVSVMATEDGTTVNFSDLPVGLIIKNYSGTTPIAIVLNKGESYTVATNSNESTINRSGLIGCLVTSNKSIVVNCGSANGSFGNGNGRDYGIDQIAGLGKVGREYIFVKGNGNNAWENVLLVAHTNNTEIRINGNPAVATINAGDYYVIEGNQYSSLNNMYVETSQDVFAYQGTGSGGEANQGMFFVPPLSCETRGNIESIANIDTIGSTIYSGGLSIVTKVGATLNINNQPLTNFTFIGPSAVPGKPDYVTYKVSGLTNNVSVQGNDELYVAYYNVNGAATSGSFYSGFPTNPEVNFNVQFATLGNCIPNVTLQAANAQSFDSFDWLFDDGSGTGFTSLNNNTTAIIPTLPGKYKLIGIISCTGETLESAEIPVSICPDDRDADGIIDNLDIDNDNDGIENCLESRGHVVINLNDTNNPVLAFEDGTTQTASISANYTQTSSTGNTNTFSGNSTGDFTSTLGNAPNAQGIYTISFTGPVNLKFSPSSVTNTTLDNAFFIAKVLPSNKNITLVDTDNQLLVDSNFDGVFEAGIRQISGSEIHFKVNPNPNGNTAFQFLANEILGFSFIHNSSNPNLTSIFSGNIALTCFTKDTDADGIKDEFDIDSDNDGIPDFIEGTGTFITRTGVDSDANGLDDAYMTNAIPIDTDNDGIWDFYDLDSDNDGVFDLIEANPNYSNLSDTDGNGIVDGPAFGANGWVDNAETAPDSHVIDYTINDMDADGIFSYRDSDSDGDSCTDVVEAGFSDGNNDNYLGDAIPTVNSFGLVNNASNGYTVPNYNFLANAPIIINIQPSDLEVCERTDNNISLVSSTFDTIQWEVSADGTNWTSISDNMVYTNSQTSSLLINNAPVSLNGNFYRAFLNRAGNSCGLYSSEINITVNPAPNINPLVTLVQCDDDDTSTLGFSVFNLTEANAKISANTNNETLYYFLSEAAAIAGDRTSSDYISSPTSFVNRFINRDTVWARVESQLGCFSISEVQLNVSTTKIPPSFVARFYQCDDVLGGNTNNANGDGIATFDFSSATSMLSAFIPVGQNPLPPRYFRNEADALAEQNEILDISNYRNVGYPNTQLIYVRIDSAITNDCIGLGAHVELIVEPLPVANTITIPSACDFDTTDAKISYPFDTSNITASILNGQSGANVRLTYYFNDINGNAMIANALPNPFLTESQDIRVVATNTNTLAPDGPCEDETLISFVVYEKPYIAANIPDQIFCDGSAADADDDNLYPFDTSTFAATILGAQAGNVELYFDYTDENGKAITTSSTLPNPLVSGTQTIHYTLLNPLQTNCMVSGSFNLVVNALPEFLVNSPQIVCSFNPSFTIILEPQESSTTEQFTYEWLWTSLDGSITNEFVSNDRSIPISTPGIYTITLTKTDGTACSRSKTITVKASELANLTENSITISDIAENNSVSIDTSSLGLGDYEYALVLEGEIPVSYQSDPFFNNVSPGFYTLYVRDQICGEATLPISVIGYTKFFTPNGDGNNDSWNIRGINETKQAKSLIRIYDRYGKLLKQISPSSKTGWDGTYNGKLVPNDDYWFRVFLEDGRSFMGHFTLKR